MSFYSKLVGGMTKQADDPRILRDMLARRRAAAERSAQYQATRDAESLRGLDTQNAGHLDAWVKNILEDSQLSGTDKRTRLNYAMKLLKAGYSPHQLGSLTRPIFSNNAAMDYLRANPDASLDDMYKDMENMSNMTAARSDNAMHQRIVDANQFLRDHKREYNLYSGYNQAAATPENQATPTAPATPTTTTPATTPQPAPTTTNSTPQPTAPAVTPAPRPNTGDNTIAGMPTSPQAPSIPAVDVNSTQPLTLMTPGTTPDFTTSVSTPQAAPATQPQQSNNPPLVSQTRPNDAVGSARRPRRGMMVGADGQATYMVNGRVVDKSVYDQAGQTRLDNGYYTSHGKPEWVLDQNKPKEERTAPQPAPQQNTAKQPTMAELRQRSQKAMQSADAGRSAADAVLAKSRKVTAGGDIGHAPGYKRNNTNPNPAPTTGTPKPVNITNP